MGAHGQAPMGGSWGPTSTAQRQRYPKACGAERRPGAVGGSCRQGSGPALSGAWGLYLPFSISPDPKASVWLQGCSQLPMVSDSDTGFGSASNRGDSEMAVDVPRTNRARFRGAQTGCCPSCLCTRRATSIPEGRQAALGSSASGWLLTPSETCLLKSSLYVSTYRFALMGTDPSAIGTPGWPCPFNRDGGCEPTRMLHGQDSHFGGVDAACTRPQ